MAPFRDPARTQRSPSQQYDFLFTLDDLRSPEARRVAHEYGITLEEVTQNAQAAFAFMHRTKGTRTKAEEIAHIGVERVIKEYASLAVYFYESAERPVCFWPTLGERPACQLYVAPSNPASLKRAARTIEETIPFVESVFSAYTARVEADHQTWCWTFADRMQGRPEDSTLN